VARSFTPANSNIQTGIGSLASFASGTVVAVVRRTAADASSHRVLILNSGGTTFRLRLELTSSGVLATIWDGISAISTLSTAISVGWMLVAATKAAGGNPVVHYRYQYSSDSWSSESVGTSIADASAADGVSLGAPPSGASRLQGDLAAAAVFPGRVLTAGELTSLPYSFASWLALQPGAMWVLDQQDVGQSVVDWTGGGANQTAITGTSVSTGSVPILSYGHRVVGVTRTVGGGGGTPVTLGQATEVDSATAVSRSKTGTLGQAGEAGTATALTRAKSLTLTQSVETNTTGGLGRAKASQIGQSTEADTGTPVVRSKVRTLGRSDEVDTAAALLVTAPAVLGQAVESGTAAPVGRSKALTVGLAVESDTASPLGRTRVVALGAAVEADTSWSIARSKRRTIGQAVSAESAAPVSVSRPAVVELVTTGRNQGAGRVGRSRAGGRTPRNTAGHR
jgi:hypothetical protein